MDSSGNVAEVEVQGTDWAIYKPIGFEQWHEPGLPKMVHNDLIKFSESQVQWAMSHDVTLVDSERQCCHSMTTAPPLLQLGGALFKVSTTFISINIITLCWKIPKYNATNLYCAITATTQLKQPPPHTNSSNWGAEDLGWDLLRGEGGSWRWGERAGREVCYLETVS